MWRGKVFARIGGPFSHTAPCMFQVEGRRGAEMEPLDFAKLEKDLKERFGEREIHSELDVMSAAMYPKVAEEYFQFRNEYGPVDCLSTRIFLIGPKIGEEFEVWFFIHRFSFFDVFPAIFYLFICLVVVSQVEIEQGKTLQVKTVAIGDLTSKGERYEVFFLFSPTDYWPDVSSCQSVVIALFCREVFFELNGQLRTVFVPDTKAKKSISVNPKAQKGKRDQVGSPMLGTILEVPVKEGDVVEKGQAVAVLSAMKMEMVRKTGKCEKFVNRGV